MKKILLFLSFLLMSIGVWGATKTEGFETKTVNTYYQGTTTITTGQSDCGIAWSIYYGNVSTTSAINGSKSCLMRYYTSASSNLGYAKTTTAIKGLTNITFNAKVTNTGNKMGIWYSTDGSNWVALATNVTLTTSSASKSYDIPSSSASSDYYVKIGITSATTDKKDLIIDNVVFTYGSSTSYTVTYDANGGSGTMTDINSPYVTGAKVTINDNEFNRNGYVFDHWNTSNDGSGYSYDERDEFNISSNIVLYAQWLESIYDCEYDILQEEFDSFTYGKEFSWNDAASSAITSYGDWTITKGYKSDKCLKLGTSKEKGSIQTPIITKCENTDFVISFRAGGWNSTSEKLTIKISSNVGTLNIEEITLEKAKWNTYEIYISEITDDLWVKIEAKNATDNRFFIDDICIYSNLSPINIVSWYNDSIIIGNDYFNEANFVPTKIRIKQLSNKPIVLTKTDYDEYKAKTDLSSSHCNKLDFIVCNNTHAIKQKIKVPYIIDGDDAVTTSLTEADCDVVVQSTLTVSGTTSVNRDVKLYKGAHLSVPSGTTYTINSLALRRDNLTPSTIHLDLDGTLNINKLYFDLYVDASDWYFVCLPNTFILTDLKYTNGRIPKYQSDYWIRLYDGEHRAAYQNNSWIDAASNKEFAVGEGFIFGLNDDLKKKEFRFEIPISTLDSETDNKNVGNLHAWGGNTNIRPNHKGWNLIGNPFMNSIVTDLASPIRIDSLVKVMNGDQWTGQWDLSNSDRGKKFRYGVFPSRDAEDAPAGYYKSVVLDDITLNPFTSFFVQIGGNDPKTNEAIVFNTANRGPLHITKKVDDEDEELFLRVKVGDRKTGMFISNKFTDEYEPGDDLESRYPIYQSIGGYKLLYSAINDSIIEHGVQVIAPQGTLYLDPKVDVNKFEYIYALYNDDWYDLKNGLEVEVNGTFIIQAKRKTKESTTSVENINLNLVIKYILDGNLYIKRNNKIYNILGDRMQ